MSSTTFTVRVETEVKKRLENLAKSTGRSRSFLAAEALNEYLDVNEWQVAGVKKAMGALDRGERVNLSFPVCTTLSPIESSAARCRSYASTTARGVGLIVFETGPLLPQAG